MLPRVLTLLLWVGFAAGGAGRGLLTPTAPQVSPLADPHSSAHERLLCISNYTYGVVRITKRACGGLWGKIMLLSSRKLSWVQRACRALVARRGGGGTESVLGKHSPSNRRSWCCTNLWRTTM
jgi:hypothetical protein